jgi:hypothetical protein
MATASSADKSNQALWRQTEHGRVLKKFAENSSEESSERGCTANGVVDDERRVCDRSSLCRQADRDEMAETASTGT